MIQLTAAEILGLSRQQAEEKLLYVRYLLMREEIEARAKIYKEQIGLLEQRIASFTPADANNDLNK